MSVIENGHTIVAIPVNEHTKDQPTSEEDTGETGSSPDIVQIRKHTPRERARKDKRGRSLDRLCINNPGKVARISSTQPAPDTEGQAEARTRSRHCSSKC